MEGLALILVWKYFKIVTQKFTHQEIEKIGVISYESHEMIAITIIMAIIMTKTVALVMRNLPNQVRSNALKNSLYFGCSSREKHYNYFSKGFDNKC